MPNVILDTSPIQYLYQIEQLDLIPKLYHQAIITHSVLKELTDGMLLGITLPNITNLSWIEIKEARSKFILPLVTELGLGERESLALAQEYDDALVVLDDALARRYAKLLKLKFTGTLGILLKAKTNHLISQVSPYIEKLENLNFRLDKNTRNFVLKLAGENL